ncbi:hypothetical protein SPRG_02386 [Saprolegnia parasitica CBS 223.65]|uniref:Dynactin subunit 3 n=1 Tax=Saprolegnia parasitica (strain CBS 223.65) TaxID=695850 RepID=A0A067D1U2_SAPPC|nr:hypothetical protein SPRG_02386 [Saprolegnia parasitica CBS 223.65]KDO32686.1 hypothetical protein SPRG_02386 [Saprolegnia parasitica CBS 223.65]|eukprot:XP_012196352.1 hypothetical protein SPRG_02386 [Saprolegnia parasitica CBS 223.65]
MDAELMSLERRLADLYGAVGMLSKTEDAPSVHVRLHELSEKLHQIENRIDPPNLGPLHLAYEQNKKLLAPGFLGELKLQSHPASGNLEQTTKTIVLTSHDMVQTMSTEAQKIQELERFVTLPTIAPESHTILSRAETSNLILAQQVMARHAQVEALLLRYSHVMGNLSKKFQLYDQVLSQLEGSH